MLKKRWDRLSSLVSKYAGKSLEVTNALKSLEEYYAKWIFVERLSKIILNEDVANKIKHITTMLEYHLVPKIDDKGDPILDSQEKAILQSEPNQILSDNKREELHERLELLKGRTHKQITESAKVAGIRVDKEWKRSKFGFVSLIKGKVKDPSKLTEIRKALGMLSIPLIGTPEKPQLAKIYPWEEDESITKWPVSKLKLPPLEDEREIKKRKEEDQKYIRFLDLLHTALREISESEYEPTVVSLVVDKYGLPHEDVAWLSEVLLKIKSPVIVSTKDVAPEETGDFPHPSELSLVDQNRRAKVTWESVLEHLPRAMHNYLKDFEAVYEFGSIFPPTPEGGLPHKDQFYLGREHRKHFFERNKDEPAADVPHKIIYLPPDSAKWTAIRLVKELTKKSVDIFIGESKLLTKGKLEDYLDKYFIKEKDIDFLIESLSQLPFQSEELENKVYDLDEQLKKYYKNPDKARVFHEWWSENQGHFTSLFKDKRMIPLFHKWMVETVVSLVTKEPIPQNIPFPVVDFIRKMSSLDRLTQHIVKEIGEVRLGLMKSPGTDAILADLKDVIQTVG